MTDEARTKLLDRLRKLHAHATSAAAIGNQAEAEAFATKVETLLLEHKLSMSEVELTLQDDVDPMGSSLYDPAAAGLNPTDGRGGSRISRRRGWLERLAMAIADAHCCQLIVAKLRRAPNRTDWGFMFVGRQNDVALASYVFHVVGRAGFVLSLRERDVIRAQGRSTIGFRDAFHLGYAVTIERRLRTTRADVIGTNQHALVRLDKAKADAKAYCNQTFKGTTMLEPAKGPQHIRADGFERGIYHGERAPIAGNAVTDPSTKRGGLSSGTRALPKGG